MLYVSGPGSALLNAVEYAPFELGVVVFVTGIRKLPVAVRVELGSSCNGGLVDPVAADSLGEHIEGRLVVFDNDIGVFRFSSSGHGGVDATAVGRCVDEEEGDIDGAALGDVAVWAWPSLRSGATYPPAGGSCRCVHRA